MCHKLCSYNRYLYNVKQWEEITYKENGSYNRCSYKRLSFPT